ncbi:MAG: gliding motility-associated C-terminal domain-containing protein [Cyclobacteriaceae bacterium]|nr:gliding motility-associated C-terminal domain-containing protein [Cyclobacteriaceae bacterium]
MILKRIGIINMFSEQTIAYWLLLTAYFLIPSSLTAQTILKAEYFFDTDPGNGNGTPITFTPTGGTVVFTTSIPTTSLSTGFHQLAIRVKETGGLWSEFEHRGFYLTSSTADAANIVAAEYFFDVDPGQGAGISIPVTAGATTNFVASIPTSSLTSGFHFLAIRTKGQDGRWSLFEGRGFYITASTSNVPNLTAAEYFFDTDPGQGNGTSIPITPGATANFIASVPTASLAPGFHFVAIRTKGPDGKWGIFESRGFYITSSTTDAPNITKAEYFFDTDPGQGNGTPISITPGATSNFTISLPSAGLTPGFHFLAIRTKGADGQWGIFESRGFYFSPIASAASDIVAAEYYIDGVDPGEGNGSPLTVLTPGPTINQNFDITINGVPSGARTLNIRAKDSKGIWSQIATQPFNVLACTPPSLPTATGNSRCNSGTVVLNATSGATGSQVYRWYADANSTAPLFTGASFTTPSLSASTDFFVSVFDPGTLCESNRVAVTAGIITTTPPVLNITGSVTICEGNSITLSAPVGFVTYTWSNGEATREISVKTAGDYTVVVGNATCQSNPSAPATIVVSTKPAKPIVTPSGTTTLCDGATVTLTAPAGFSYTWSTGATTQAIVVSATGSYSVVVANASNCASAPSDAIQVIATTTPTKPVIEVFGSTALCGINTVGLLAPSGFSIYQWSNGQTTQGITVSAAGTYSVIVGNAVSCLSLPSTGTVVTATGQPCSTSGGTNAPPVIDTKPFAATIEGKLVADLTLRISDPDNNINFSSLRVINNITSRGVFATISSSFELEVDYANVPFTGVDRITLEVCDLAGACAQQVIDIEVVGEVEVFNGITPDGDGLNDFLLIKYLDVVEGAAKNKVTILNRWGDAVFEMDDYDNLSRVFTGQTNSGSDLPSGTYFYKIDFLQSKSSINGFITLKR